MTLLAFAATGRTAADVIDRRAVQQSMDIACRGTWPNAGEDRWNIVFVPLYRACRILREQCRR